jgi:hypothetical protein
MGRDRQLEGVPATADNSDDDEEEFTGGPLFNADGSLTGEEARATLRQIVEESRASGIVSDFSIERIKQELGIKSR